jgi:hypothetical protein
VHRPAADRTLLYRRVREFLDDLEAMMARVAFVFVQRHINSFESFEAFEPFESFEAFEPFESFESFEP